jgi:Ca2+/H+ antiporter
VSTSHEPALAKLTYLLLLFLLASLAPLGHLFVVVFRVTSSLYHALSLPNLCSYAAYLTFQLGTHSELFEGEEDDEEPNLTTTTAMLTLAAITVTVAIASEYLTGSIEAVSSQTGDDCRCGRLTLSLYVGGSWQALHSCGDWLLAFCHSCFVGMSEAFLGIIVLPIAGNACEHITAVVVAMKNKMDLALGVAMGSSLQVCTAVTVPSMATPCVQWLVGLALGSLCFRQSTLVACPKQ